MTQTNNPSPPGAAASTLQEIETVGIEAVTAALTSGPQLIGDAENVFNTIAHGAGGVQKIQNAIGALAALLTHAHAALASATGSTS